MDSYSSNLGLPNDTLVGQLQRYVDQQRSNLSMGDTLNYSAIKTSQLEELGVLVRDIEPEETIEVDPSSGPAMVPTGNSGGITQYQNVGMKVAAWGGYQNGNLPLSALKAIGPNSRYRNWYQGFYWLRPDAADAWIRLQQHAKKDGVRLTVTSAYRNVAHQATLQGGGRAAAPGKSPHGWALAVDIGELYFGGTKATSVAQAAQMRKTSTYKWIDRVGPQYGWYNPERLRDGRSLDESWHFEHYGTK